MPNKYKSTIYGLDIETSTVHYIDGKQYHFDGFNYVNIKNSNDVKALNTNIDKSISYMISYCISSLDTSTGIYHEHSKGRTYSKLNTDLENIKNDKSLKKKVIYCHNFAYEFSFLINNLPIFKDCNGFYMDKNKPLKVEIDTLEFRCSYLLLNKSIKKLGSELDLPKLEFEYNKVRTPLSTMSKKEWEYNFRDVEIMLKSVYKLMCENPYINEVENIPLTKTGISRLNCKKNKEINQVKEYKRKDSTTYKNSLYQRQLYESEWEKATSEFQLNFWERLFKGGFVYSNPGYCNLILDDVMSFDFSSDYPYQMLYRKFPRNFYEIKLNKNKREYLNEVLKNSAENALISKQPYKYMINCIVKIKNINAKYSTLPLSESNIDEQLKNGVDSIILNGKIKSIYTTVTMYLSHIDLIILKLFYDFEITDILYLEKCNKITESSEYRKNCVLFNGIKKSEYKVYKELIEHLNEHHHYSKDEIKDEFIRNMLNTCTTYQEQLNCINQNYLRVKSDLNSLYGDNAQHLNRNEIYYDFTDREFKEDTADFTVNYIDKRKNTSYIYGLYVPAYARASILYFVYKFATLNVDTIYIDTDSLKIIKSDYSKVKHVIDNYNSTIKTEITNVYGLDFGTLEYEHTFNKFTTLGSKSYVYMLGGRVYATVSGLPKASELYQELYHLCGDDYNSLIDKCYHFNVCIDSTVTNKLCAIYKFDMNNTFVNGWYDTIYSGCVLKPVSTVMRDTNSKTWELYANMIEDIYNLNINKKRTLIKRKRNGDITIC